jgi:hypothetical protein
LTEPPSRRSLRIAWAVIAAAVITFVLVGSALALERHWGFERELGLDKAYFFQRVWQAAWMDAPQRTLLGTEQGQGLVAGRHVEPMLALAVPFVRWFPRPEALLLLQVALVGLGGLAVGRLGLKSLKDPATAVLCTLAWLSMPGLMLLVVEDFRTLSMAIPFALGAWAMLREQRLIPGLVLALLAAACREEVGLLMLAALPALAWPGRPRRRWAAAGMALAAAVAWLVFLRLGLGRVSDFFAGQDLWGGLAKAFGGSDDGGGWAWTYAAQWAKLAGGTLVTLPVAPLAALVVVGNWLGSTATSGYVSGNAYHLWAVGLAGMGLVLVGAAAKLGRWPWVARVTMALVLLGNLVLWPEDLRGRAMETPRILSGATAPAHRVGTPWTVIHAVPTHAPVLADARYVAMLADRPVIYATDDWHDPDDRAWLTRAVDHAVVPDFHDWVPLLQEAGFETRLESGGALLMERVEPAPELGAVRTPG